MCNQDKKPEYDCSGKIKDYMNESIIVRHHPLPKRPAISLHAWEAVAFAVGFVYARDGYAALMTTPEWVWVLIGASSLVAASLSVAYRNYKK